MRWYVDGMENSVWQLQALSKCWQLRAYVSPDPPKFKFTAPSLSAQLLAEHKLVLPAGLCFSEAGLSRGKLKPELTMDERRPPIPQR